MSNHPLHGCIHGHPLTSMGIHGHPWASMGIHGHPWAWMSNHPPHGCIHFISVHVYDYRYGSIHRTSHPACPLDQAWCYQYYHCLDWSDVKVHGTRTRSVGTRVQFRHWYVSDVNPKDHAWTDAMELESAQFFLTKIIVLSLDFLFDP